jgi:hypothetical protein
VKYLEADSAGPVTKEVSGEAGPLGEPLPALLATKGLFSGMNNTVHRQLLQCKTVILDRSINKKVGS